MRPKFAARRWKGLSDKWKESRYYSRNPSHQQANLNLRLRRSLSWLERAERERKDCDASFVFYWITFNAAYGQQHSLRDDHDNEKKLFHQYLRQVIASDWTAFQRATWAHLQSPIESLMRNEHVFQLSWQHQEGESHQDWKREFNRYKKEMEDAFRQRTLALWQDTLCELFNRLYTLRNQLLHGGATYRGSVNRTQVEDGARIMATLMPCFIEVMIDHPESDWGLPRYPVRPDVFPRRSGPSQTDR